MDTPTDPVEQNDFTSLIRHKFAAYVVARERVSNLADEIEKNLDTLFRRYLEHDSYVKYSCDAGDYHLSLNDVHLSQLAGEDINPTLAWDHDCFDHGYDVHEERRIFMPWAYVVDPDGWEARHAAKRAQQEQNHAAAREVAERAELARLQAKYPIRPGEWPTAAAIPGHVGQVRDVFGRTWTKQFLSNADGTAQWRLPGTHFGGPIPENAFPVVSL